MSRPQGTRPACRSPKSGRLVCGCRRGYASEVDGKCTRCRGHLLPQPEEDADYDRACRGRTPSEWP